LSRAIAVAVALGVLLGALPSWWIGVAPLKQAVVDAREARARLTASLETRQEQVRRLAALRRQHEALARRIDGFGFELPQRSAVTPLIERVSTQLAAAGVEVDALHPTPAGSTQSAARAVHIAITGDWATLVKSLDQWLRSPLATSPARLVVQAGQTNADESPAGSSITLELQRLAHALDHPVAAQTTDAVARTPLPALDQLADPFTTAHAPTREGAMPVFLGSLRGRGQQWGFFRDRRGRIHRLRPGHPLPGGGGVLEAIQPDAAVVRQRDSAGDARRVRLPILDRHSKGG
jgi:Tfp pilus assembly protein PilO